MRFGNEADEVACERPEAEPAWRCGKAEGGVSVGGAAKGWQQFRIEAKAIARVVPQVQAKLWRQWQRFRR